jgi:hypothetical protein
LASEDGSPTVELGGLRWRFLYFTKPSPRRAGNGRLVRTVAVFPHRSGKGRTFLIDALPHAG